MGLWTLVRESVLGGVWRASGTGVRDFRITKEEEACKSSWAWVVLAA